MTLQAATNERPFDNGVEIIVSGEGRTLQALNAHPHAGHIAVLDPLEYVSGQWHAVLERQAVLERGVGHVAHERRRRGQIRKPGWACAPNQSYS